MPFQFQYNGKFALLAVKNAYTAVPDSEFQLSDGTWVMHRVPVSDLGIWKEWIGSIRTEQLGEGNLVLFVEEESDNPEILDAVHQRLTNRLIRLFHSLHLRQGIECEGADLLCGSCQQGTPRIRQMAQVAKFFQSKGYRRAPITQEWLE